MAKIKQLLERGSKIYPLTSSEAVVFSDGNNVADKLDYIYRNYERYQDLVDNLDISYNASSATLDLKLGQTTLSSIPAGNFAVSGILTSASYDSSTGEMTLNFDTGDSAVIDLNDVLESVLSDFANEVESLRNLHIVLTEEEYDTLVVKDNDTFYYTYEDDEDDEDIVQQK